MLNKTDVTAFPTINHAYNHVFQKERLSIGLILPIEAYSIGANPTMNHHIETAQLAEQLGFMLITGGSRQSPDWGAEHGDGWITYPRDTQSQGAVIADYRRRVAQSGQPDKPVMQSLYIDLLNQKDAPQRPIHLGFQSGVDYLKRYLTELETLGVNHVALNLRFNQAEIETTLKHLTTDILPDFTSTHLHS